MGINKSRLIDQQHTRIELPLCGYEHSWLVFYRAKPLSKHTQDNGITYLLMDEESAVEVERVRVNQPMLITNIRPHKVVFDRPFLDRINIVLHTDPDLRQLLD